MSSFSKSFVQNQKKKISSFIVSNNTMCGAPAPQAGSVATDTIYGHYLMTIVSNKKLSNALSFDDFYKLIQKIKLLEISFVHSYYELQPISNKLHIHAIVKLPKNNPNAFKFNYFPKLFGKGYNYDFKVIETVNHLFNCYTYEKDIPQPYLKIVYDNILQVAAIKRIPNKAKLSLYKLLRSSENWHNQAAYYFIRSFDDSKKKSIEI